jgi:hypothetical protein
LANEVNFIPQIDYTSRDYSSIREDLINLIPTYAPQWTNRDPSDLGIALIEIFSYLGDLLNFYIDRAANEGFLATASQRDSVLQIAAMLNYTPTTSSPALVELTLSNSTASAVTIPAGTQVATTTVVDGNSVQIIFETDAAAVIPAKVGSVNGTITVTATQGYTISNEVLGVSSGSPNQIFKLVETPVIKDSVEVFVNGIQYTYSPALIENTIYDPVFTTVNDAEGNTYVIFGDGVGGRIPTTAGSITATYRVGAGTSGNVPANKLSFFLTNATAGITVNNQEAAVGGEDEESTDSIKTNAPLALRSLNRAVSLRDYASLALQVPGVAKAVAESEVYTSVNLYIAPFGDLGVSGVTPTAVFNALATDVGEFFTDKTAPNVTLNILPPTYLNIDVDVTVYVLPQYRQDIVTSQALAAVKELFSAQNSFFADRVTVHFLLSAINQVSGVDYAQVTYLRKSSELQSFSVSQWSRTSNIVTLTTTATHSITVGQTIKVSDVAPALNTSQIVLSKTSTTLTFANVGSDVSTTSVTGTIKALTVDTVQCATNEIPNEGTFTISASGGIS